MKEDIIFPELGEIVLDYLFNMCLVNGLHMQYLLVRYKIGIYSMLLSCNSDIPLP